MMATRRATDIKEPRRKRGIRMDICVICGTITPEGRQICGSCELTEPKELIKLLDEKVLLRFTIPLNPITKKNSMQIIINKRTGRPMPIQSKAYRDYEKECSYFMKRLDRPIDTPINIKAIYYRATKHRVDITNLHSALHDILTKYGVIQDDDCNIVKSTDGSRVRFDKRNPRTEIIITEVG